MGMPGVHSRATATLLLLGLCQLRGATLVASSAEFKIDRSGSVKANLRLDLTAGKEPARLLGVLTPCDSPVAHLESSPDVRVAFLAVGSGYSAISLLVPGASTAVPLTIEDCLSLEETSEGKLKITLDYSYSFAGEIDRTLIRLDPKEWQVRLVLPGEFDETLVSYNPVAVERLDRTSFVLRSVEPPPPAKAAWIVFPNTPSQRQQRAKLVLGVLLGIVTSLVQVPAFRARRLELLVGIAALAAVGLALTAYYAVVLPGRLDMLVWLGASMPHLLMAIFGSIYVAVAKRSQATIAGVVNVDGQPALLGRATLLEEREAGWRPLETVEQLDSGKYLFNIWVRDENRKLKVQAQASNRSLIESAPFAVARRQQHAVEVLESPALKAP